jgi:DNA-directed RNA polymerase specialized sigma24 family protein
MENQRTLQLFSTTYLKQQQLIRMEIDNRFCKFNDKFAIIDLIAHSAVLKRYIHKYIWQKHNTEDLLQEIYVILLEKTEQDIINLNKNENILWQYIFTTVDNQINGKRTIYDNKYKKYDTGRAGTIMNSYIDKENLQDYLVNKDNIEEETLQAIGHAIDDLDWYKKTLFLKYLNEDKTLKELSLELHIDKSSIHYAYKTAIKQIKTKIDEQLRNI